MLIEISIFIGIIVLLVWPIYKWNTKPTPISYEVELVGENHTHFEVFIRKLQRNKVYYKNPYLYENMPDSWWPTDEPSPQIVKVPKKKYPTLEGLLEQVYRSYDPNEWMRLYKPSRTVVRPPNRDEAKMNLLEEMLAESDSDEFIKKFENYKMKYKTI
jgi:hypothetical protein